MLLSLLSIHSSCFVSLMLIVLSTFHVIYPFLSKIFIYIPVYMYCPVVLWCFVIMCDLWPFKGQTIEFVTNYPVLLILHVGIMNNYNKTTVHNIILFILLTMEEFLIEVLLFTTFVYTCIRFCEKWIFKQNDLTGSSFLFKMNVNNVASLILIK